MRWCCLNALDELAYAHGGPVVSARLRHLPEDFIVEEVATCRPYGEGEHAWLLVQKRGQNTEWVARELARFAGVENEAVSYAGLKDRHALTTQAFTVQLGQSEEPDWQSMQLEGCRILEATRHRQRLRRGMLRENRFTLSLRDVTGQRDAVDTVLARIAQQGVPNYFGPQRFGREGGNLLGAERLFNGEGQQPERHLRGLYLSAARSYLFNRVLSERVSLRCWSEALPGEALIMPGSDSTLSLPRIDAAIQARIERGDLQPSGPLWGRGQALPKGEALLLEQRVLAHESAFCAGLERAGLKQQRRALVLRAREMSWEWLESDRLQIRFSLPPGSYATSVLRELIGTDAC